MGILTLLGNIFYSPASFSMASARADARRLTISEVQMSCLMSAMSEPDPDEGRGSLTMPVMNPLCDPS